MTTKLVCRGCGGPRHQQGTETVWYYECNREVKRMGKLNDFHNANWRRMHEAFPPAHDELALVVCIQEEMGELAAAVLGVTGEKKRKAHLTRADVWDACADAATYLSLLIRALGGSDLEALLDGVHREFERHIATHQDNLNLCVARAQYTLGSIAFEMILEERHKDTGNALRLCALLVKRLESIALSQGCENWHRLLGNTFNMVSERAGSPIRTELGQA